MTAYKCKQSRRIELGHTRARIKRMLSSFFKEASHLQMNKTCGQTLCIWKLLLLYVGNYTAFDTLAVINKFLKNYRGCCNPCHFS